MLASKAGAEDAEEAALTLLQLLSAASQEALHAASCRSRA